VKHLLLLFLPAALFLLSSPASFAQDESHPPVPKFTAAQAVEKVTKYVQDHEKDADSGEFIISVVYGRPDLLHLTMTTNDSNTFVADAEQEWSWFVTFWSHTMSPHRVYRLKNNGVVTPLIFTES